MNPQDLEVAKMYSLGIKTSEIQLKFNISDRKLIDYHVRKTLRTLLPFFMRTDDLEETIRIENRKEFKLLPGPQPQD